MKCKNISKELSSHVIGYFSLKHWLTVLNLDNGTLIKTRCCTRAPDCILFSIRTKYFPCQKNLMAQLLHIYRRIMIWMAVAGSVNVKVAVKVVRDKAGLHQIRGEQLRGPGRYPDSTRHHTQENVSWPEPVLFLECRSEDVVCWRSWHWSLIKWLRKKSYLICILWIARDSWSCCSIMISIKFY